MFNHPSEVTWACESNLQHRNTHANSQLDVLVCFAFLFPTGIAPRTCPLPPPRARARHTPWSDVDKAPKLRNPREKKVVHASNVARALNPGGVWFCFLSDLFEKPFVCFFQVTSWETGPKSPVPIDDYDATINLRLLPVYMPLTVGIHATMSVNIRNI